VCLVAGEAHSDLQWCPVIQFEGDDGDDGVQHGGAEKVDHH
jgi:hypothetical protein